MVLYLINLPIVSCLNITAPLLKEMLRNNTLRELLHIKVDQNITIFKIGPHLPHLYCRPFYFNELSVTKLTPETS